MKTATVVLFDRARGFYDPDVAAAFFLPSDPVCNTSSCSTPALTAWQPFLLPQFRAFRFPVP